MPYNFKKRKHAEMAVEAARERAAGVVHVERVRFAPRRGRTAPKTLIGVTSDEVTFLNSVEVTIYASDTPGVEPTPVMINDSSGGSGGSGTGQIPQTVTAWFDWIAEDNPEPIPANTDVAIEIAEHGEYRIIRAACGSRSRV